MIIHDCEQNSDAWYRTRAGLVTASEFSTIQMQGKGGGESLTRAKYLRRLAGERITGEPVEGYTNGAMARGHEMEPTARAMYALMSDGSEVNLVGFVTNDKGSAGASPDSLIGVNGALEIKTATPHVLIEHIERAAKEPAYFPAEHAAQCQGVLWVCEREWIDLAIFWPRLPLFVKRAYRDEPYIGRIRMAVDTANDEIDAIVARVRAYMPEAA